MTAALLDIPQARAEELVDTLVGMQLLDVVGRDASGQLRYRFHDLLRVYAREVVIAQKAEADRLAALDRAFGGWLALAEEAGRCMASSDFANTGYNDATGKWCAAFSSCSMPSMGSGTPAERGVGDVQT